MENLLVSIIVPVYNNKHYLRQCIDSIKKQIYKNIECIVVDDGSDSDYAEYYDTLNSKNIKIFHRSKETDGGGVSSARNYGLKRANGDYICFVDSDDIIHENYVYELVSIIEKYSADIAACGFVRFDNDIPSIQMENITTVIYKSDIWYGMVGPGYSEEKFRAEGFLWNKLYRKDVLKDVLFDEKLGMCEDQLFVFEVVSKINAIAITKDELYFYRKNYNSSTGTLTAGKIEQAIYVSQKILKMLEDQDEEIVENYKQYSNEWYYLYCQSLARTRPNKWRELIHEKRKYWMKFSKNKSKDFSHILLTRNVYLFCAFEHIKYRIKRIYKKLREIWFYIENLNLQ